MTKWKQRRREREQLVQDIAVASAPVFLKMILEQSIKHNASGKQAQELRQTAAECAWAHGEIMARLKA
jgi:hypothetical protein